MLKPDQKLSTLPGVFFFFFLKDRYSVDGWPVKQPLTRFEGPGAEDTAIVTDIGGRYYLFFLSTFNCIVCVCVCAKRISVGLLFGRTYFLTSLLMELHIYIW